MGERGPTATHRSAALARTHCRRWENGGQPQRLQRDGNVPANCRRWESGGQPQRADADQHRVADCRRWENRGQPQRSFAAAARTVIVGDGRTGANRNVVGSQQCRSPASSPQANATHSQRGPQTMRRHPPRTPIGENPSGAPHIAERVGRGHCGEISIDEIALPRAVGRHRPGQLQSPFPLEPPQRVAHPHQQ